MMFLAMSLVNVLVILQPPTEDGGQSDLMRMLNAESKKLLNHSLIHTVERYPLFALRVWEVGGLLSEFQRQ